ncbi:50S ribosomal protein L17 [Candidatus Daviesbacteria bacterium RIFOXYD1_FULL_41_10]|uniref:50S ribosomal protein L17 n=1 Tax=Candidatus Daviesbacteria bacterium RIFOXYD1_FULL_41_10 TaxID=1797801 RepID=A0A1F5N0T0_9BACT|nr:MAG: 50S ribosomal protein L17 [Candidatus Daviesbacteria bacterium RIFOXYD1_FULL_41_10]
MKHNVYGKHLGRNKNQRQALFRGLVRSLFLQESITTTEAKAAAIKGLVDKLIAKARNGSNASKNVIFSALPQKEVSDKLLKSIAPRYGTRVSGFTNSVKLGIRHGDGAMMVKMSLMEGDKEVQSQEIKKQIKSSKIRKERLAPKR